MRISRLDLLAFGPFTGQSLCFEGPGLHIVYGDNEAGKSSSLRALRQWLYGIPPRSTDDFVHSHPHMRIGGALESSDGRRLEFVRRKGQTKTIRASDDGEPIDEAILTQMLAGIDEAAFRQRFGIDYPELREGGKALVAGGGDLKEILFAAGAGIADLGRIQKRLDEEASALFKPRGATQRLNKAIAELTDANREIKKVLLPPAEWVKCDEEMGTAHQRQEAINKALRERRALRNRLARLSEAALLVNRKRILSDRLAKVADSPLLAADFAVHRQKAATELANAQQAEQEAVQEMARLEKELAKLEAPTVLLEYEATIDKLKTDLGGHEKAARDKPALVESCTAAETRAVEILRNLGRTHGLERAEEVRPSRKQRERIQSLAGDYKRLQEKHTACEKAARSLRRELEGVARRLDDSPAARDASELQRAIRQVLKRGELDDRLATLRKDHRETEKQVAIKLSNLPLFAGSLEQLERLCVPSQETVDYHEGEIEETRELAKSIADRLNELAQSVSAIEQQLARLEQESDVPTENDMAHARQRRDEGWRLVKQAWLAGVATDDPTISSFVDESAEKADLAAAFQESTAAADAIADRLRREAARVAEKASLASELQARQREAEALQQRLASAQQSVIDAQFAWREAWKAAGIDPLSPREMRAWLQQQADLALRAKNVRQLAEQVAEAEEAITSHRGQLSARLAALSDTVPSGDGRIDELIDRCQAVVDRIALANRNREQGEETRLMLREKAADAEEDVKSAIADIDQWRSNWSEAVATLGLDARAAPDDASLIDESLALLDQAGQFHERVRGIDRDAEEFTRSVRGLLAEAAADLLASPVEHSVKQLHARLARAKTEETQREQWQAQLAAETRKRDRAKAKVATLSATIAEMRRQARCASNEELPDAERRSAERREVERLQENVLEQLAVLAAGENLQSWIEEVEGCDPDQLQAEAHSLDQEILMLDGERDAVAESIGNCRARLAQMNGGDMAAEAQGRAQRLLARIRNDAEQYVRLKLAGFVLGRSMERFRKANQGPVLARASELFSELTLGSFAELQADYDDQGNAVLVGVRSGGKRVTVEGMSEGSCDQLYLALRLALLESYLDGREPMPFIVDDILIMFDDDRSLAALRAFARLAEKTQVIFFTHHEHLVRLARENLDDGVLVTHTLDHRALADSA